MKRITLSAAAARLVERQISGYEDERDDKAKPVRDPKERRQWDRIADDFVVASGECYKEIEAVETAGVAWGNDVRKEEADLIEQLQSEWRAGRFDPDEVTKGLNAIKVSYELRIGAKENEIAFERQKIEESAKGLVSAAIDLDDSDGGTLAFLRRVWPQLDINTSGRLVRRLNNEVKDALDSAVELVKDGDRYVPKRPKLVAVDSEAGG